MCEPVTIATLALSAASSVASYTGQRQQARAQEGAARDALIVNQQALDVQQLQQNERASQEMSVRAREALMQRGRLNAIAAEGGAGNSMDRIAGEINLATATDMATIERNRVMQNNQSQLQKAGMRATAQSQINMIKQPSEIGLALDLMSTGLKGASLYDKRKSLKIEPQDYTHGTRDYW